MISLLLATAVTTGCLFSTTSCEVLDKIQDVIGGLLSPEKKPEDGKDNVIKGSTAHGNQTATGVVKKPSMDVQIKLIRGKNVLKTATKLKDSAAEKLGQVAAYPHAYANRVTRNEVSFFARNAIDGRTESNGHGTSYPSREYDQKSPY